MGRRACTWNIIICVVESFLSVGTDKNQLGWDFLFKIPKFFTGQGQESEFLTSHPGDSDESLF